MKRITDVLLGNGWVFWPGLMMLAVLVAGHNF